MKDPDQDEIDRVIKKMLDKIASGEDSKEVVDAGLAELEKGEPARPEPKPLIEEIKVEVPEVETIDLGEYCVDCRDPVDESTEKFASRRPEVREQSTTVRIQGFLCEDCFPLEGTLMEPTVQALKGRRWDEQVVRERMRAIGEEELYERVVGPYLDLMQTLLRLER